MCADEDVEAAALAGFADCGAGAGGGLEIVLARLVGTGLGGWG